MRFTIMFTPIEEEIFSFYKMWHHLTAMQPKVRHIPIKFALWYGECVPMLSQSILAIGS